MAAVQMLGLGMSSHVSPAAAPDGHVWCLMGKTGWAELSLFKDEMSSVETTPSFACMGLGGDEGRRKQ